MARRVRCIGSVICLVFIALMLGAAPVKPPVPIVTIVKSDGTSVRGQLGEVGRDQLTIILSPKPGAKVDSVEPITVPWKEIKSVSNGLTPAKALVLWKEAHVSELCETCNGDGVASCPTCKGTGHDPASGKDCNTCHGELLVDCKAPKCKDGKIPCPRPCIKLSEGKWVKKDDGKIWREIPMGTGTLRLSSGHAGQIWVLENGAPVNKGICPTCGGTSFITCTACHGTAKVPCPTCLARKDAPACPNQCDHGHVQCTTCKGKGLKAAA